MNCWNERPEITSTNSGHLTFDLLMILGVCWMWNLACPIVICIYILPRTEQLFASFRSLWVKLVAVG